MPGELGKVKDKSYSKGKGKNFLEKNHTKKRLDTGKGPHNNHTLEDQGQPWDSDPG